MKTARVGLNRALPAAAVACVLTGCLVIGAMGQEPREPIATDWGQIRFLETGIALEVAEARLPTDGIVRIPRLNSPVAAVYLQGDKDRAQLKLTPGVRQWEIALPIGPGRFGNLVVMVETVGRPHLAAVPFVASPTASGTITLSAHHAITRGERLRYEPQAHKNTVGYWSQAGDWCEWHFAVEKSGRYELQILQGCGKSQGGSEVAARISEQELIFTVEETGHFQNFKRRTLGVVTLEAGKDQTLELRPRTKVAAAIMDVRQIQLVPLNPEP